MTDERPPRPPRRPLPSLRDDEVVFIPPAPDTERSGPRKLPDVFSKLVQTPSEQMREIVATQRKMALQLDGFGQAMNRRFDLFHEELAMLRTTVTESHEPRLGKMEATLGQKMARGGGIVGVIIVALPLLSEVLPKWKGLFDSILGALQ